MQLLQTLILIFTLLSLPSNLLTSSEMRFEDISLLDPTAKLPLIVALDYTSLNNNPPCTGKYKCAVHSRETIAPSLKIETNLKCRSGNPAPASRQIVQR